MINRGGEFVKFSCALAELIRCKFVHCHIKNTERTTIITFQLLFIIFDGELYITFPYLGLFVILREHMVLKIRRSVIYQSSTSDYSQKRKKPQLPTALFMSLSNCSAAKMKAPCFQSIILNDNSI